LTSGATETFLFLYSHPAGDKDTHRRRLRRMRESAQGGFDLPTCSPISRSKRTHRQPGSGTTSGQVPTRRGSFFPSRTLPSRFASYQPTSGKLLGRMPKLYDSNLTTRPDLGSRDSRRQGGKLLEVRPDRMVRVARVTGRASRPTAESFWCDSSFFWLIRGVCT
jgi:hypothetical protein